MVESQKGPQTGKVNEVLGFYDPVNDKKELETERIKYWIDNGAQVSDTIHNMLVEEKIIEGKKINVLPKKTPVVKEEKEEEKSEEAPAKEGGEAPTETGSAAEESVPEEKPTEPEQLVTPEETKEKSAEPIEEK